MKRENIFGICAFAAFVLILQEWSVGGVSVRTLLIALITAAGIVLWLNKRKKTKAQSRKITWDKLDCLMGICLVWNILRIVIDYVKTAGFDERNLLTVVLVMLFFWASMEKFSYVYIDVILICAFAVFVNLLWHFMIDASYTFNLKPFIEDEQTLTSFLLLINVIATGKYCDTKDRMKQKLYFIIALTGYFLLFINSNVIGIVLMGISFMVFLLVYEPHREFVRKNMQMAFVYFFMLSNMSLLVNYTTLINAECQYSLENSVYLELVIALAGVFFFTYWDKLPEDEDRPLYEMQKVMKWIMAGVCIVLFLLLAMGHRLNSMDGAKGISVLLQFSMELRKYAIGHNGTFYDVLGRYGIVGGIWLIGTVLIAMEKMQKRGCSKRIEPLLSVIFVMYLAQSAFFSQQNITTPIYAMMLAAALYNGRVNFRDNKTSNKKEKYRKAV
ncbi:MAG: hypothetical protein HDR12_16815 [Lachnospiraceae bacterium]|nr:hypothetical protein [Lachnospiraceae bacterium]